ncbi:MAG: anti-sigma factor [Micrococcaceae bacterium]|nr:anti-sigma factor [Micrococcaceae bacterium]
MEKQENELTGSFALNAIDDAEREELLLQAESSPGVREELEAMRETAALLGLTTAPVQPPASVKTNIMAAIRNTPQLPPLETEQAQAAADNAPTGAQLPGSDIDSPADRSGGAVSVAEPSESMPVPAKPQRRMFALAAGVLLVAAGALGGVVVNQHSQQQELEEQLAALNTKQAELTQILTAADVQSKTQKMGDGARVTLAYSAAEGMMAVTTSGMPALPSDKGYELWLISSDGAVPAGMVDGSQADGMVLVSGSMDGVTHFGITVEPASGSPAPTTEPILVQAL